MNVNTSQDIWTNLLQRIRSINSKIRIGRILVLYENVPTHFVLVVKGIIAFDTLTYLLILLQQTSYFSYSLKSSKKITIFRYFRHSQKCDEDSLYDMERELLPQFSGTVQSLSKVHCKRWTLLGRHINTFYLFR